VTGAKRRAQTSTSVPRVLNSDAKHVPSAMDSRLGRTLRVNDVGMFFGRLLLFFASLTAAPAAFAEGGTTSPFPARVSQGALVIAKVVPGSEVKYAGKTLRIAADGTVVFGVGRDEEGPLRVSVKPPRGAATVATIAVDPRDWPIERIEGVPPATVEPPPEIAERIQREQARVVAARARDDARTDFEETFAWPVSGRISGRFGNQRVYVVKGKDVPKSPHAGMDIAVPEGTPVKAPAAGIVTFADRDLYLTGGTVLLDHGHGVSSNFLHLSRIDVKVGDRIEQGQVIGAVGHTGRATGPHLHWGMNWFDVRIDPLLLFEGEHRVGLEDPVVELIGPTAVAYANSASQQGIGRSADGRELKQYLSGVEQLTHCAESHRFPLGVATVGGPVLLVREKGQPDVELVLAGTVGAYLFWPGKKPGRSVIASDTSTFAQTLAQAAAEYFEQPECSAG